MPLLAAAVLLSACFDKAAWFDSCDCGDNLCVRDGSVFECMLVPDSCAVAFAGECNPSALDHDCAVDVCGAFIGEWDMPLDCRTRGSRVYRYTDCTNVGTATE